MAARRQVKISGGVINIRLHPHDGDIYDRFIKDIYSLKTPIKLRGDRHAIFSLLNRSEANDGIYSGVITTFVKIELDGSWFSTEKLGDASPEEISEVNIPAHIHPNSRQFYFIFDAKEHKFYFQSYASGKTLSHKSAYDLIRGLASDPKIVLKYGDVKVDTVQSKEALDYVFELEVIKEVKITINKPNADFVDDDFEEKIESHLASTGSRSLTLVYEAERGGSIEPTSELKAAGAVALNNGLVEVKGRDANGATSRSTNEHPETLTAKYNPAETLESTAFRKLVAEKIKRVLGL